MKKRPSCVRTRLELQMALDQVRRDGRTIGFVPTMGALHDGHLSLVRQANQAADVTVVSIFVNPAQFAPGEDLDAYPRNEAQDVEKLGETGCDIVYLPSVEEMYPDGNVTNIRVEGFSDMLDGIYRPHFFYGVATVVARLFIHVEPDVAVFGEKDYQQLQIIRRMVKDLGFRIEIIGGETTRERDGLAQSSRNAYLSTTQRQQANAMSLALHRAACRMSVGGETADALAEASDAILAAGFDTLDYVSAVDPDTLQDLPPGAVEKGFVGRVLAAAWLGRTRLIDNMGFARLSS